MIQAAVARLANDRRLRAAIYLTAAAISLWLKSAFPVSAVADAGHDDALYLRTAINLIGRHWLGVPYTQYRLMKGMFYPLFVDLSFVTGVPLKILEQLAYLAAALLASHVVKRLTGAAWPALLVFIVLAFNPIMFHPVFARVVREGIYVSLSLAVVALAAGAFLVERTPAIRGGLPWLVGLGLASGAFWLTREEGLWLLPALAPVIGLWLLRRFRSWRRGSPRVRLRQIALDAALLAIPLVAFLAVVHAANLLNFLHYGVYQNNELRSAAFPAAYGALSRIEHDRWRRFVVFPRDARERAYGVSPAVAELRPYLDGPLGEGWRRTSCGEKSAEECPEILAGWFIWAFRDAVDAAGHYGSASDARNFYRRLAGEIDAACADGRLPCRPPRASLMPPFRAEYIEPTMRAARSAGIRLTHLGNGAVGSPPSTGTPDNLAWFDDMLGGAVTPPQPTLVHHDLGSADTLIEHKRRIQTAVAGAIAHGYAAAVPVALPIAVVVLAFGIARRRRLYGNAAVFALAAACFLAIAARIALIAYIDATSFPADSDPYLSPATPFLLLFIGLCLIEGLSPPAGAARRRSWAFGSAIQPPGRRGL